MILHKLTLNNFRNYILENIEFVPGINIFVGKNAQGKTNILEAVRYASLGRSHRTRSEGEMIRWQESTGRLLITFNRHDIDNELEVKLSLNDKPKIIYNNYAIKHSELIGSLNSVLFSPEDLLLIKGSPLLRRRFLDSEISQASPIYYRELLKYNRVLTQRNILLKKIREQKAKANVLEVWDEQLATGAAHIVGKRLQAVEGLSKIANEMQREISDGREQINVAYRISGNTGKDYPADMSAWYEKELEQRREKDVWRGSTSVGPHHDDLEVTVNGVNLRSYGSQGQQRTGVLALKLAELSFLRHETGEYPILLLDDVMSELDKARREKLLQFIRRETIQTLVTATEETYFPFAHGATIFEVTAGTVKRR